MFSKHDCPQWHGGGDALGSMISWPTANAADPIQDPKLEAESQAAG